MNKTILCPKHRHAHYLKLDNHPRCSKALSKDIFTDDINDEDDEEEEEEELPIITEEDGGNGSPGNEEKKKKKRRKNKKRKKKSKQQADTQAAAAPGTGAADETRKGIIAVEECEREAEREGAEAYSSTKEGDASAADPEFEENLKQFSLRLQMQQSSMLSSARVSGRFRKLRPNISADWLSGIKA
jgi:hypothetical protein